MQNYLPALITGAFGIIATIVAAFLSAKWGARQALQQRWWGKKEQAYTEIIEALHDLLRYSAMCLEEFGLDAEEHPRKEEFRTRYSEAYWNIQKMTDIGAFVISKNAADALQKLRNKPKLDWDEIPPWEIYEADCTHYRKALDEIRQCAKKDLKI